MATAPFLAFALAETRAPPVAVRLDLFLQPAAFAKLPADRPWPASGEVMKKLLGVVVLAVLAYAGYPHYGGHGGDASLPEPVTSPSGVRLDAQASGTQVQGSGVVTRVLSDDEEGSRHQRFILRLPSGQTVLVAHNIDLAPRVDGLEEGDTVAFNGEFVWNPKGGVVHWTHHDPSGRHVAGWLKHQGQVVQ